MNIPNLPVPEHSSQGVIDSTKIQCYQSCPRQFFYEYVLGWRSARPNNHLFFGAAVHEALEHIILNGYRTQSVMEAFELFNAKYREVFPESTDILYSPKTPARFMDMMILYLSKYQDDLDKYEVYKTEFGGTIQLSETHSMAFKMDTILQNLETGLYFSLEHKTKGGNYIGNSYTVDFEMGIQLGCYTHVLNCLFPPEQVEGVTINCMCFKKTKQPDYILKRFPINLTNSQMYIWLENTKRWIDMIEADYQELSTVSDSTERMNCFTMNGRSCSNWGRTCLYYDLCTSWQNPVAHQDKLPANMEVSFWNPLEEELREKMTL